jgi:hypothetical protein
MTDGESERAVPGTRPRLVDQTVMVRLLAKVQATMAAIAVSDRWTLPVRPRDGVARLYSP